MPEVIFSERDREQIISHGLTESKVNQQIDNFTRGFGYLPVVNAAAVGNGILKPGQAEAEMYVTKYRELVPGLEVVKFVPASGAATRMFKDLFSFTAEGKSSEVSRKTVEGIKDFAFYCALPDKIENRDDKTIIEAVLAYGAALPKGLIFFHCYDDAPRTAFEEHLVEGALYAQSGGKVKIHFTISQEHRSGFEHLLNEIRGKYEDRFGITYDICFSVQDSSTDTIAVTPENEPFRNPDGSLLFRPAGHGALIGNLDSIDADIIFIKNIDNVAPDRLKGDTVRYKQLIGGILLEHKRMADSMLDDLLSGTATVSQARELLENRLFCKLPAEFDSLGEEQQKKTLLRLLDRPMRVCGMVRNEGEPGGGPFWSRNGDGTISLQIAEPSQVSPQQAHLLREGTHFNPVDIVCAVKNHKGSKFDLTAYTDPATGFISEKSKDGRKLMAQELPGLWNGAMADWITIFAEVPVSTFSPVKEITDLLREEHRSDTTQ